MAAAEALVSTDVVVIAVVAGTVLATAAVVAVAGTFAAVTGTASVGSV